MGEQQAKPQFDLEDQFSFKKQRNTKKKKEKKKKITKVVRHETDLVFVSISFSNVNAKKSTKKS